MLDAMETDLDAAASALDALDTDDLDAAERVVDGLAPADSGGVFAWDGQRIPA